MAKRASKRSRSFGGGKRSFLWPNLTALAIVCFLLSGIIVSLMAVSRSTTPVPSQAAACSDNGCQNVKWKSGGLTLWQITNCGSDATSCDGNGDQQLCNAAGRIGECGGKSYCCPSSGQQWTSTMTACSGSAPYSACGVTSTSTPTPIPTSAPTTASTSTPSVTPPTCNGLTTNISSTVGTPVTVSLTCSGTAPGGYVKAAQFNFGDGSNQTINENVGSPGSISVSHTYYATGTMAATCTVEDNNNNWSSSCQTTITISAASTPVTYNNNYTYNTPTDSPTSTPLPIVNITAACNQSCTDNLDCPGGLLCVPSAAGGSVCRNAFCTDNNSCICETGSTSGGNLTVVPSIAEPTPITGQRNVILTVSNFTDSKGNSNNKPNICGFTEPGATVDVSILPDGVSGEVTADNSGKWCWQTTKELTGGKKDLLVVAKKSDGQGQVKQSFTAVATKAGSPWGWIILLFILIAVGFGGYVYYKSL